MTAVARHHSVSSAVHGLAPKVKVRSSCIGRSLEHLGSCVRTPLITSSKTLCGAGVSVGRCSPAREHGLS
eukprot:1733468-Amphidinium_carterae.1